MPPSIDRPPTTAAALLMPDAVLSATLYFLSAAALSLFARCRRAGDGKREVSER